jgi:flagellar hook-length control protein FliK
VHVSVTNDQANLLFNAPHAVARDAIQAALPRLQEMLSEGGLTLGNVSVGTQGSNGQRGSGERRDADARNDAIAGVGDATSSTTVRLQRALGMVDLFA